MKYLTKSRKNRVACGVCGGIGEYFGVDPLLVRLLFLALSSALGSGLLVYVIAALLMPEAPKETANRAYEAAEEEPQTSRQRYY